MFKQNRNGYGLASSCSGKKVEGVIRLNTVTVYVKNVQVEHEVKIDEFTKWLERKGISPAEMTKRAENKGNSRYIPT